MPGGLNPGLTIHLYWSSLEERNAEVGALGNADSRAQPTLDLALDKTKAELATGAQGVPQGLPTSLLVSAHHVHDTRYTHHLQQPVVYARLLKP